MAFNSIEYLTFLIGVVVLFRCTKGSLRLCVLMLASYYFYARWNEKYLFLIIFSTFLDYFCALWIDRKQQSKKLFLMISLIGNCSMLFFFKYYGFFSDTAQHIAEILGRPLYLPILELLLPVGISFYTLQTMSYSLDVYRGKIKAEKNFLCFAVYVANFPQLVAGPIEKAGALLPQIHNPKAFNEPDVKNGSQLILWGLFKKVVVADRLAAFVEWAFDANLTHSNEIMFIAGFMANLLIYADFSAYADIAKGSAKLMGIELMNNFNFPLFSRSMPDFWKRWHVSLHQFFLDYVYFPLGGGRVNWGRRIFNIWMVFILSGLWHGAAWNFVLWSIFHFLLVMIHILFMLSLKKLSIGLPKNVFMTVVQITLVHFQRAMSMYLFFMPDWEKALGVMLGFVTKPWLGVSGFQTPYVPFVLILTFGFPMLLMLLEAIHIKKSLTIRASHMPRALRWFAYYGMIFCIMIFGVETNNPFIYFQF